MNSNMALTVCSPGSPSSTLYTTIHLSDSDDMACMGKRRRKRTIITADQLTKLEGLYRQEQWPNRERKEKLAKEIGMSTHFVNIWFQNKRSRMKKMAQEEAELAAMKTNLSESENEKQDASSQSSTGDNSPVSASMAYKSLRSPARSGPIPIAPLLPKSPLMPVKTTVDLPELKQSPHVVCVKLPLAAQSPNQSTPKRVKLNPNHNSDNDVSDLQPKPTVVYPAQFQPKPAENTTASFQSPGKSEAIIGMQQATSPAAEAIQKLAHVQQQNLKQQQRVQSQQNVRLPLAQPQVRFATNTAAASLPVLQTQSAPEPIKEEVVYSQQVSNQESIPSSSTACGDSYPSPQAASTYNLFDCLVAMAAVEEGGGIVQRQDPIYDIAVNSALYGIKVDEEMVLTHDKQKGLKFNETES